jgi:hypothetical protein
VEEEKTDLAISTHVTQFEPWNKMQEPPEHNQSCTLMDLINVRSGRRNDKYNVHNNTLCTINITSSISHVSGW